MQTTPQKLIDALRKTDPYIRAIFTQGGCYRFFLFLQNLWPEAVPVINQDRDHVAALIDGTAYDIDGVVTWHFRVMNDEQIKLASTWSFAGKAFLNLGECPVCEEPLLVTSRRTSSDELRRQPFSLP